MAAIELPLADEAATTRLGEDIAAAIRPGDLVLLDGDLGAGKTTLARGLIRALAGDLSLDVPSPTFTLVQPYDLAPAIRHFDLYRLASPSDLDELGLDEALAEGAALVEWPDRAGDHLPRGGIRVALEHHGDGRLARIDGPAGAMDRVVRSIALRTFLASAGWGDARRSPLNGDASARAYERVRRDGADDRILMNSPPLVLGPPVQDGRAYAEIAHTSRTIAAFVAIARLMGEKGFCVPDIHAADLDRGFALIENLGSGRFLDAAGSPVAERYAAAAELLADMHALSWPDRAEAAPGVVHVIPPFDRAAMQIEADLLIDWYWPAMTGTPASPTLRDRYRAEWAAIFDRLEHVAEPTLMQRDYHSPNIIWRDDRKGRDRLGLVDFQDALIGPSAYDLASLAMDARVTIPPELERRTRDAYIRARRRSGIFSEDAFVEAYAIMAAQRNAKILGIFVRLDRRDGKPAYLAHLPRIRGYFRRALEHPALAGMRALAETNGLLAGEPA
ncbi:MAG: tRNA (adenosine(37)-N6)-threonylcarbamoyltransferase complex ATPase subunit type 1 TsaE [Rhizobiaceae bacterium]|nr:tRNA (adenosine(37)-N6)-threonylcarbamoyltransferase complex ATPase subunit type 1 TsaE [Rhizobiaceae bacterium]